MKLTREEFEAKYFPGSKTLAPGVWVDAQGALHLSLPDILAHFGYEDTIENREMLVAAATEMFNGAVEYNEDANKPGGA